MDELKSQSNDFMIKDHPKLRMSRELLHRFIEFLARNNVLYKADQKRVMWCIT